MERPKPDVYLHGSDEVDARSISLILPDGVEDCYFCWGNGKYVQRYMEGRFTGVCDFCKGSGFTYKGTSRGVPLSVTNQIAVASGYRIRNFKGAHMYGLQWVKDNG